jgi:hypothetical protein
MLANPACELFASKVRALCVCRVASSWSCLRCGEIFFFFLRNLTCFPVSPVKVQMTQEFLAELVAIAGGLQPCMMAVDELNMAGASFATLEAFKQAMREKVKIGAKGGEGAGIFFSAAGCPWNIIWL